ncbi:short transient receptor potential channel, partial [Biomphalaria glabrata]
MTTLRVLYSTMFRIGSFSEPGEGMEENLEEFEEHDKLYYNSFLSGPYFQNGLQFLMGRTFAK